MAVAGTMTLGRIQQVVATDEPVMRNLLITQAYHDLSVGMAELLGMDNATWCTFGCWASKTAGSFIRGDEVPLKVRQVLNASPFLEQQARHVQSALQEVAAAMLSPVEAAIDAAAGIAKDLSLYVGQGNKMVFEEMGEAFARFIDEIHQGGRNEGTLNGLLSEYRLGPPQPDAVSIDRATATVTSEQRGGQSLLREMVRQYFFAMQEPDVRKRAQLVLLANALGGIHEQTRLQSYIVASLDAPIGDLVRDRLHRTVAEDDTDLRQRHQAHAGLDCLLHPFADEVTRLWQSLVTVGLMTLQLPDVVLHLGEDVPAPRGEPLFPSELATIDLPSLRRMLLQYDALTPGERRGGLVGILKKDAVELLGRAERDPRAAGSAATDWARLSERMRYILALFRSRQRDPQLFSPPFSADQSAALAQGAPPSEPL
jgi:hypothetical protein